MNGPLAAQPLAQRTAELPVAHFALFTALLCAAVAARTLLAGPGRRRARALFAGPQPSASPPSTSAALLPRWSFRRPAWLPARAAALLRSRAAAYGAGCLLAGLLLALWGRSPLPLLAALLLAPWAVRAGHRGERLRAEARQRASVISCCTALAGEVRAGRQPEQALQAAGAAELGAPATALLAAARFGGDIPEALRRAGRRPGGEGLRAVAACWQVAVDGGASLARGLDRVAQSLRAERDQREELRSQLAGPRATALILALLPLIGLLLGAAMGARPLHVLLHSPPGLLCLALGVALEGAGLAWTAAIIRHAEGGAP